MSKPITAEYAKQICSDFLPVSKLVEGKKKTSCHYLFHDELCKLDHRFVCEIKRFRENTERRERLGVPSLSASKIDALTSCPRKFALRYVFRLEEGWKSYLLAGTAFGNGRAKLDQGLEWNGELQKELVQKFPVEAAKVRAALNFYRRHPPYEPGSVACERTVEFIYNGEPFVGYVDAVTHDGKTLREWKFAQRQYEFLRSVRQAAIYFHGMPDVNRYELWCFPKPSHRPKKKETMEAYSKRVEDELEKKNPREVYRVTVFKRSDLAIERVIHEAQRAYECLPVIAQKGYPPNYSNDCEYCSFKDLCEQHTDKGTEPIGAWALENGWKKR